MTNFDYAAAIAAAAETSTDMNVASAGGGDYAPPAEGKAGLRFVAYIETGKQEGTYQGKPKVSDKVFLVFELHGPKWPLNDNGEPQRITVEVNKSQNEKAGFYKMFKTMNYEGKARIFAQLLGGDFQGKIIHRKYKNKRGKEVTVAELYDKVNQVYTIEAPFIEDEEGNTKRRNVPPAITPIKVFLWDSPSKGMWDSIFIDGEYPERKDEKTGEVTAPAKSKNKFQLAIKGAKNFKGSPIEALLDGVDDEALNSVGKSPEQVIAEKKAASSAGAVEGTQAGSTANAEAAAASEKSKPSTGASKLPDHKTDSAGAGESEDDELGDGDDLPF
ncbi:MULTISPECIES: hypothetical protein [Burkholderia cepacia complex]|nr:MULTISPECIES: hypothetical protein [Burkholderia cepacia complex]MDN8042348.1 hypothetical protein [Burkholderia vietnamiensis]HDR9131351.1 hypothetical protein [Burkholderia vietnamiensis]